MWRIVYYDDEARLPVVEMYMGVARWCGVVLVCVCRASWVDGSGDRWCRLCACEGFNVCWWRYACRVQRRLCDVCFVNGIGGADIV